jgi:hypothetical protein
MSKPNYEVNIRKWVGKMSLLTDLGLDIARLDDRCVSLARERDQSRDAAAEAG